MRDSYLEKIILLCRTEMQMRASSTEPSSTSAMHLSSVFLFRSLVTRGLLDFFNGSELAEDASDLCLRVDLTRYVGQVQRLRWRVDRNLLVLEAVEFWIGDQKLVLALLRQDLVEGYIIRESNLSHASLP